MSSRAPSYPVLIGGLTVLSILLFAVSLLIGPAAIGFWDSLAALIAGEGEAATLVMREIRLPRAILGFMIGAT
ncbi:MAG: iron chelate uptake ABC transporter family permease subunit, partial [Pseudomonadota bacterium]